MKQVVQDIGTGKTSVRAVADPLAIDGHVVVATVASAISAGTERYVVDLSRKSLLGKARQRPEDVKRALQKITQEGLRSTLSQISAKLDEPMSLGYSAAGIVLESGFDVQQFKLGDRVAVAAPHSGISVVPKNLCVAIPDPVSFEQAAYTSIAAIALQGIRLAHVSLGDSVVVLGLGLIGQIAVCLLKAQGCRVFGTDVNSSRAELATSFGADRIGLGKPVQEVKDFSGTSGVDAVIITASTESNEPIEFAAEVCRPKGRIVLVGVVGMQIPRPPFFKKELEFTVSSSLGPGRGDPLYEEKGVDYPIGHVRWTAQRNMSTVLDLMSQGKLPVERLTTHRFQLERAPEAYDLITSRRERFLGIVLEYPAITQPLRRRIDFVAASPNASQLGVSLVGAGNFARLVMVPALTKLDQIAWRGVCTAKGMTSEHTGRKNGFAFATTDAEEIWKDKDTNAVFIATRHNLHADLVIAALRAGKHVFVEKPLCINLDELSRIAAVVEELADRCPILTVGFNRRFSPALTQLKNFFTDLAPLSMSYRFSPGYLPHDHWTQDIDVGGGRIVGEACHAIDTCVAIAGSSPKRVFAESVAMTGGVETTDDRVFITVRHQNGSISSISYQSGGDAGFPSERIEVFGGGRTGVIDAWKDGELWSGKKRQRLQPKMDKGHATEFSTFIEACKRGGRWPISWDELYGVSWASLMAVRSLREGTPFSIDSSIME